MEHNQSADEALVEAVARAIMISYHGSDGGMDTIGYAKYGEDGMFREDAIDAARAALAAARSHGGM